MRRLSAATLAACLLLTPGAEAQQRSDGLRALLNHVPATLFETGEWADITYTDLGAARVGVARDAETMMAALFDDRYVGHYLRAMGLSPDMNNSIYLGLSGEWQPVVGFNPQDLVRSLSWVAPPDQFSVLELAPTVDFAAVEAALQANDYSGEDRGDWTVLWWGETDYMIDLQARDQANPFGGNLGRSSRLALQAPFVASAPAWPLIDAVTGGIDRPAAELPALDALLAEVDDPRFGEARLVNLMVLPIQQEASPDPSATPSTPAQAISIPRWEMGLFADISTGTVDYALAAFAYDDAKDAGAAAETIETAWSDPQSPGFHEAHRDSGSGAIHVTDAGGGWRVVALVIERPMAGVADAPSNRPYRTLIDGLLRGDLPVFGLP